ncbi:hypothetical protein [Microcoleus sp. AR_TQ3_B6]|uniref:hypothetical protein n=1 Tax=Microcoleus sp. AR_TQ3_B6 TaxID=3055284 RepID=UPI002FD1A0A8
MTIQRARDLLSQSNTDSNELRNAIIALENEKRYVENCILLEFRSKEEGEAVVNEISLLIKQLRQRQCTN